MSQTIRGVTVRVTQAKWDPFDVSNPLIPFFKTLQVSYTVQADPPLPLPPNKSLLNFVTAVTWVGPDGGDLATSGAGGSSDSMGRVLESSVNTRNVDPRWPMVYLRLDFVDPSAPARDLGRASATLVFPNIPAPTQTSVVTACDSEAVTPLGARVIVDKVEVEPGGSTTFAFHVKPPPDAPDLRVQLSSPWLAVDDTGATLGHGGGSAYGVVLGEPNSQGVIIGGVPSPGAKMLTLTLPVTESSEALRQNAPTRHFHIPILLKSLYVGEGRDHFPLATVRGKRVFLTLDSLAPMEQHDRIRLILRDLQDQTITWEIHALRGQTDAGQPLTAKVPAGDAWPDFYWKVDGEPLAPGDTATELFLGTPSPDQTSFQVGPLPPAKTLTLTADVEAVRSQTHLLDFVRVPVPSPGQTLALNRTVQDALGGRVTLQKVLAYDPAHPLPAGLAAAHHTIIAPTGLALVLAEPPDPAGHLAPDYRLIAANGPAGDTLQPSMTAGYLEGDALSGDPAPNVLFDLPVSPPPNRPRLWTLLLHLPDDGARTFNMRLGHNEVIPLGLRETLTLPPVPAPPLAPASP